MKELLLARIALSEICHIIDVHIEGADASKETGTITAIMVKSIIEHAMIDCSASAARQGIAHSAHNNIERSQ